MAAEGYEVCTEGSDIHLHMRHRLAGVDHHPSAHVFGSLRDGLNRIDCAEEIALMNDRNHFGSSRNDFIEGTKL